jgi:hypothetical protein
MQAQSLAKISVLSKPIKTWRKLLKPTSQIKPLQTKSKSHIVISGGEQVKRTNHLRKLKDSGILMKERKED